MNKDDSSFIKAKSCIENRAVESGTAWALLAIEEAIYELTHSTHMTLVSMGGI